MYFELKKVPENLKLPLVLRAIKDPFAQNWVSYEYQKIDSYQSFKSHFSKLFWNEQRRDSLGVQPISRRNGKHFPRRRKRKDREREKKRASENLRLYIWKVVWYKMRQNASTLEIKCLRERFIRYTTVE
jgi:hypothetical protein